MSVAKTDCEHKSLMRAPALCEITPTEWDWLQLQFPHLAQSGKTDEIRDLINLKRGLRNRFRSKRMSL